MGRPLVVAALAGLTLGVTLGLAGCSGSPAPSASTTPTAAAPVSAPAPSASSASSPSSASSAVPSPGTPGDDPSASASPSLTTLPASECLTGTWQLVRFVAASGQAYGTGQGGDLTIRFSGDGYTLAGAGKEPVEVTLTGQTADLTVDGRATGTYALDGSKATFTDGSTRGSGTVELGGRSQRLTMDQVTSVVGLKGQGDVACAAQVMTITLSAVRLELARA